MTLCQYVSLTDYNLFIEPRNKTCSKLHPWVNKVYSDLVFFTAWGLLFPVYIFQQIPNSEL